MARWSVCVLVAVLAAGCSGAALPGGSIPASDAGACGVVRDEPAALEPSHIADGETFDYPQFPPSSGPHDAAPLPPGVYRTPLTLDAAGTGKPTLFRAVHSLEHGYVIVFHNAALGRSASSALASAVLRHRKVIVAPARSLRAPLVLVAWERVLECERFDAAAVEAFLREHVGSDNAPEPDAP